MYWCEPGDFAILDISKGRILSEELTIIISSCSLHGRFLLLLDILFHFSYLKRAEYVK